jgi:hypothetical protein
MASMKRFLLVSMVLAYLTIGLATTKADVGIGMGPSRINIQASPGSVYSPQVVVFNPGDNDVIAELTSTCPWVSAQPNTFYLASHTSASDGISINVRFSIPNDATSGTCNCVIGFKAIWSNFGQIGTAPAVSAPVTLSGVSCPTQPACSQKWVCTLINGQNFSSLVNPDCSVGYQTPCLGECDSSSGLCMQPTLQIASNPTPQIESNNTQISKPTPSICGPQFALILALVGLGASMIMWGLDKSKTFKDHEYYEIALGRLYIIIGFFFVIGPAILLFLVKVC